MHEFGIAKSLVESVLAEAEKNNATSVSEVILDVGELSFIGIEQLKFAYEILVKEIEVLANSSLTINKITAEVLCDKCGYSGPLKRLDEPKSHFITPVFACPSCSGKVSITKGRECIIKNIRMTVDEDVSIS